MTKVKRIPLWARRIEVHKKNDVTIDVTCFGHYPFFLDTSVLRPAGTGSGRWMHIAFANAEAEPELLDFMANYGPVNGKMLSGELYPVAISQHGFKHVTVEQQIGKLRDAQGSIAAATRLVALLQLRKPISFNTVNPLCRRVAKSMGAENLDQELENQADYVNSEEASKKTIDLLAQTEASVARDLICQFLDRFPPKLGTVNNRIVELPGYDETGVLPIICYLLRQDFLSSVRTIGICERCGRLFAVTRRGAQFCSAECSQLKRSLDYYHAKASKAKKQRGARSESAES